VYSTGIMEIITNRLGIHYYSLREIPEKLLKSGRACVKEFGIVERFFHFEFFETPDGEFWGLEVNVRPPGGYSLDMMNYAAETDVYRAWARMMVLGENQMEFDRKYFVAHVGRRGESRYRHGYDYIMNHLGVKFVHCPWMPELWKPVMGDEVYILGDASFERLESAIEQIEELA
jgi:aryl-phospho-beta-D-glucosidase BglC (GH1 family)